MAGGFGAASLPLISAIALLVGAVFLILGFAAPNWAFDGTYSVGLWRYGRCEESVHVKCYAQDQPSLQDVPGELYGSGGDVGCQGVSFSIYVWYTLIYRNKLSLQ